MDGSSALISAFTHGLAAGAMLVIAIAVGRSGLGRHVRAATVLMAASMAAWVIVESQPLFRAMGAPTALDFLSCPVAGLFWLFLLTVFADWRVTPLTLAPALILLATGVARLFVDDPAVTVLWTARNVFSAALAIHAGALILRGRNDDLVERRRSGRVVVLSAACLLVLVEVTAAFGFRITHDGSWLTLAAGHPLGGALIAALTLAMSVLALTVQPAAFGASRRREATVDSRAEAADRRLVEELEALMAREAWRREGLTIGAVAADLGVPEHRLRRLINQRLGHRNFADFLNGHRIAAAKRRLADPAEARTTVAAIAFDLGFGSLGPFNRAFRAATGASPTEWRRQALAASPELQEAV